MQNISILLTVICLSAKLSLIVSIYLCLVIEIYLIWTVLDINTISIIVSHYRIKFGTIYIRWHFVASPCADSHYRIRILNS